MPDNSEFSQEIAFYAFRYALGKKTDIVEQVSKYLILNTSKFSIKYKDLIIKEINQSEKKGWLGMECDKRDWLLVRDRMKEIEG